VALEHDTSLQPAANVSLTDLQRLLAQSQLGLPLSAAATPLPVVGVHEPTVAAIIDRALALPPDTPIGELPEAERTFVWPVEDRLCLLVVRLMDQTPLTEEIFATYTALGISQQPLLAEEFDEGDRPQKAFSFETLAARHNFRIAGASEGPATQPDALASEEDGTSPEV
jgi:hypothetical protein